MLFGPCAQCRFRFDSFIGRGAISIHNNNIIRPRKPGSLLQKRCAFTRERRRTDTRWRSGPAAGRRTTRRLYNNNNVSSKTLLYHHTCIIITVAVCRSKIFRKNTRNRRISMLLQLLLYTLYSRCGPVVKRDGEQSIRPYGRYLFYYNIYIYTYIMT